MIWKPNTTVAAIIEKDGRFLILKMVKAYLKAWHARRSKKPPTNLRQQHC
jgi:hypothetical protein